MRNIRRRNSLCAAIARYLVVCGLWIAILLAPLHPSFAQSNLSIDWTNAQSQYPIGVGVPVPRSCPVRITMRMANATPTAACYQPVRFQVRPIVGRTFPSDGTVNLRLEFNSYGSSDQTVVLAIPVRAGDSSAESGILMRWGLARSSFQLKGAWNGRTLPNLSAQGYFMWSGLESQPMQLVLASSETVATNSPEIRAAFDAIEDSQVPLALATLQSQTVNTMMNQAVVKCVADVARMPSNWLPLAHFDEIVATREDLRKMDAAGHQVLNHYIWCGGRLRVQDAHRPSDLEESIVADWDRSVTPTGILGQVYRAGFGFVVLGKDDRQTSDAPPDIYNHRSRMSRVLKNLGDDYWQWLIPEVGKTPIWTFLGMVTLLVGVGAPAILIWSQKMQRRVWTILAIPVLSLASVLTLSAYAGVKDGWRSMVRIRSLTLLDSDGNGAVWSRQTYFAGTIPDGKIRVGAQTELIPLQTLRGPNTVQYQDDSGQGQIHSGILTLRQQKQVSLTHWVREVKMLLMGETNDTTTGMPITKNASDSNIVALVCSDAEGRLFRAEQVSPGEIVDWQATDPENASQWLKSFYDAQSLTLPPDAPEFGSGSLFSWLLSAGTVWGSTGVSTSGFEEEAYWSQELANWGPDTRYKFAAVVDHAPQLEKCLENAQETSSLHMVIGHWRPSVPTRSEPNPSGAESDGKALQQ
jgi:hypothetical protein